MASSLRSLCCTCDTDVGSIPWPRGAITGIEPVDEPEGCHLHESWIDSQAIPNWRRSSAASPMRGCLVLGDVMLDRYVSGSASRLSPEAPIPVLRPTASRATLGGAANVALNIATLGGAVVAGRRRRRGPGRRGISAAAGGRAGDRTASRGCARPAHHGEDPLHGRRAPIAAPG